MKVRLFVPTARPRPVPGAGSTVVSRPRNLAGLRAGFLDNSKPNVDRFLDGVAEALNARYGFTGVLRRRKPDASGPIAPALLQELARECDFVVNAVPD
jgi:hypothetical protein